MEKPFGVTYLATHAPAKNDTNLQSAFGRGIMQIVEDGINSILYPYSGFEPGLSSLCIRLFFDQNAEDLLDRMRMLILVNAHDEDSFHTLDHLVSKSALAKLYGLVRVEEQSRLVAEARAICDIVRFESLNPSLISRRENPVGLNSYYERAELARKGNVDFLSIDALADALQEDFMVEIVTTPPELAEVNGYVARYISTRAEAGRSSSNGFVGAVSPIGHSQVTSEDEVMLCLPRSKDPLASSFERSPQRLRDELKSRSLLFHARVFARSVPVAQSVAAAIAECAFENGSYRLVKHQIGDRAFESAVDASRQHKVFVVPSLGAQASRSTPSVYEGFDKLAQIAPVESVSGIFRFPIASDSRTRCFRKSTDSPALKVNEVFVLGHECVDSSQGLAARPVGIRKDSVSKSLLMSMIPGNGKTMTLINLMIQFWKDRLPFLLIAPIAGEEMNLFLQGNSTDSELQKLAQELRLYTPGGSLSPMTFNVLQPYPYEEISIKIEQFVQQFGSCYELTTPLVGVLKEGLQNLYRDFPAIDHPPRVSDLIPYCLRAIEKQAYGSEVESNLMGAIRVRLGALTQGVFGQVFNQRFSYPSLDMVVNSYVVLQLDTLPTDMKKLFTLFYLPTLQRHIIATMGKVHE